MTILKTSLGLLFLFAMACDTTKTATSENQPADTTMTTTDTSPTTKKMLAEGFIMGTIVASKEPGDCPYTIRVENDASYLLDPINLDEAYKKEGQKIWVKYAGLKMMNRCEKANPVNITDISRRQ